MLCHESFPVREYITSAKDRSFFKRNTIIQLYEQCFGVVPCFGNISFPKEEHAPKHIELIHRTLTVEKVLHAYRQCFGMFDTEYRELAWFFRKREYLYEKEVRWNKTYIFIHEGNMIYPDNRRVLPIDIPKSFISTMTYLEYLMFRLRERFEERVTGKLHERIAHSHFLVMADGQTLQIPIPYCIYNVVYE